MSGDGRAQARRYASTRRRGSARANQPAIRPCTASSPGAHVCTSSISVVGPSAAGTVPHPPWRSTLPAPSRPAAGNLPQDNCGLSITKEKPGCWTRRRGFAQSGMVRISSYFRTLKRAKPPPWRTGRYPGPRAGRPRRSGPPGATRR